MRKGGITGRNGRGEVGKNILRENAEVDKKGETVKRKGREVSRGETGACEETRRPVRKRGITGM